MAAPVITDIDVHASQGTAGLATGRIRSAQRIEETALSAQLTASR